MFELIILVVLLLATIGMILLFRSNNRGADRNKYDSWVNHNDDIGD